MRGTSIVVAAVLFLSTATSAGSATASSTSQRSAAKPAAVPGQLLFTRTASGDVQTIYAASGRAERRLSVPGLYCCLVRVSPDHRRILVMPGGDIPLPLTGGTIDLRGAHFARLRLVDATLNLVPQAWSPDGSRIAFEGWDFDDPSRGGVYTARACDGGDLVRVSTRTGGYHDMPLDYSPDGRKLVFYRQVALDSGPTDIGGALWVVNVDGSDAHQITTARVRPNWWARWSPDGSRILFAAERLRATGGIWTVRPDGSRLTQLYAGSADRFPIDPVWSPDGKNIMFGLDPSNDRFTHPANALYLMRADGTHLTFVNASPDFKSQLEWWRG